MDTAEEQQPNTPGKQTRKLTPENCTFYGIQIAGLWGVNQ